MRLVIAGLMLALTVPAAIADGYNVGQCKSRCGSQYNFCKTRSTTKQARKACKATRKLCKNECTGKH
jgi:hypothetical protein